MKASSFDSSRSLRFTIEYVNYLALYYAFIIKLAKQNLYMRLRFLCNVLNPVEVQGYHGCGVQFCEECWRVA